MRNQSDPGRDDEVVWNGLESYADRRLERGLIRPFHAVVFSLLRKWTWTKNEADLWDKRFKIWKLVDWGIDACQRQYFWGVWDDRIEFPITDNEEMLVTIWQWLGRHKEIGSFLETNYQQISQSARWLLSRYAFRNAWRTLRVRFGFWRVLSKMLFDTPILAGIVIGWLVLLQADEAVKFIFGLPVWRVGVVSVAVAGLSFFVVEEAAASREVTRSWRRALVVILLALLISGLVGMAFLLAVGNEWLNELLPGSAEELKQLPLWWGKGWGKGWRVLIGWTPMAVFIGIFTQVIWTGRAPTEPITPS